MNVQRLSCFCETKYFQKLFCREFFCSYGYKTALKHVFRIYVCDVENEQFGDLDSIKYAWNSSIENLHYIQKVNTGFNLKDLFS